MKHKAAKEHEKDVLDMNGPSYRLLATQENADQ